MTESGCVLCGSTHVKELFKTRDRLVRDSELFSVVKCVGCGLVYTLPEMTDEALRKYYPEEYYAGVAGRRQPPPDKLVSFITECASRHLWMEIAGGKNMAVAIRILAGHTLLLPFAGYIKNCLPYKDKPGRLLDIGCGGGRFLAEEKSLGWDVFGVERSEKASCLARESGVDNMFVGDFKDASYEDEFFDIVVLNHVLEHFSDPGSGLSKIRRILKPDGILIIRSPNLSRIETFIFGERWQPYEVPRHRFHFDKMSLGKLLVNNGFSPARVFYSIYLNSIIRSIRNFLADNGVPRWIISYFGVDNKMLRIMFLPFGFLLKLAGQSGEIVVYAGKGERCRK